MEQSFFICPICGEALNICERSLKCKNFHCYDIAKQGYVNLLLPSGKGVHGDNKEMIRSRKDFLGKGYYYPLAEKLTEALKEQFSGRHIAMLDAGCGEGYYTEQVVSALSCECVGIDISKDALIYASKRLKSSALACASVYRLPFKDSCFDLVLSMFAPYSGDEYSRVMKDNGKFFMVIPGKDHLFELKSLIYDTPYKNEVQPFDLDNFKLISCQNIKYQMEISSQCDIEALFKMTPYYYRTSFEKQARIKSVSSLSCTAEFHILGYEKDI